MHTADVPSTEHGQSRAPPEGLIREDASKEWVGVAPGERMWQMLVPG